MNSCEQQCIWGQDLQVIGWVEELAILSSTSSFLHVVVARHNSVADGERETEGGWKYNANVINFKLLRTVMTHITSKGQYFNRYDSPNVLLTIKKRQGGRLAIYFFWYFRLFCFFVGVQKMILEMILLLCKYQAEPFQNGDMRRRMCVAT